MSAAQLDSYLLDEPAGGGAAGKKRKNRGNRMGDIIKAEEEPCSSGDGDGDNSTQSNTKRLRGETDDCVKSPFQLAITADMDDVTRSKIRREKNRVAARKCRAKKLQFMVDLQKTLRDLMRENEEYRLQVCISHITSTATCSDCCRSVAVGFVPDVYHNL